MDSQSTAIAIIIMVCAVAWYLMPAIIGYKRGVNSPFSLLCLNLLLGWTVLGWIVCLIWAVSGATRAQDAFYKAQAAAARPVTPTQNQPWR